MAIVMLIGPVVLMTEGQHRACVFLLEKTWYLGEARSSQWSPDQPQSGI
jgi:hypothetical protein